MRPRPAGWQRPAVTTEGMPPLFRTVATCARVALFADPDAQSGEAEAGNKPHRAVGHIPARTFTDFSVNSGTGTKTGNSAPSLPPIATPECCQNPANVSQFGLLITA